jgi:hypothetical protein
MSRRGWLIGGGIAASLLVAAALAIAIAGDSSPSATPPGAPDEDAARAFQDCLAEQGVDPPEPAVAPAGPLPPAGPRVPRGAPPEELGRALEECNDLLPEGAGPPGAMPQEIPLG